MKNYYHVLGLQNFATSPEVRRAFKQLAVRFHPDKNPNNPVAEERFKEVNEAYQFLSDEERKGKYDLLLYQNVDLDDLYARYLAQKRAEAYAQAQQRPAYSGQSVAKRSAYDVSDYKVGFFSTLLLFYLLYTFTAFNDFVARWKFYRATQEYAVENYDRALELLGSAASYDNSYSRIYYLKAQCWLAATNSISQASSEMETALMYASYAPPEYLLLFGEIAAAQKNSALADSCFTNYQSRTSTPERGWERMGKAYFYDLKHFEQAGFFYDKLRKQFPENAQYLIHSGIIEGAKGDFTKAEQLFDEALKHSKNVNLSAEITKLTEKKLGMLALTIRVLDVQLQRTPGDLHTRNERIRLLRKTEQYEKALQDADWLCEALPEDPKAFFTKAQIFLDLGKIPEACDAWQIAKGLGYAKPHKNLAFFCDRD